MHNALSKPDPPHRRHRIDSEVTKLHHAELQGSTVVLWPMLHWYLGRSMPARIARFRAMKRAKKWR